MGNYVDPDGKKLIIHSVQLVKQSYVENSRSTQRSYAKKLMESENADAAIVAFFTPGDQKWRLSFVRLDYEIKFENGKINTTENKPFYSATAGKVTSWAKRRTDGINQMNGDACPFCANDL